MSRIKKLIFFPLLLLPIPLLTPILTSCEGVDSRSYKQIIIDTLSDFKNQPFYCVLFDSKLSDNIQGSYTVEKYLEESVDINLETNTLARFLNTLSSSFNIAIDSSSFTFSDLINLASSDGKLNTIPEDSDWQTLHNRLQELVRKFDSKKTKIRQGVLHLFKNELYDSLISYGQHSLQNIKDIIDTKPTCISNLIEHYNNIATAHINLGTKVGDFIPSRHSVDGTNIDEADPNCTLIGSWNNLAYAIYDIIQQFNTYLKYKYETLSTILYLHSFPYLFDTMLLSQIPNGKSTPLITYFNQIVPQANKLISNSSISQYANSYSESGYLSTSNGTITSWKNLCTAAINVNIELKWSNMIAKNQALSEFVHLPTSLWNYEPSAHISDAFGAVAAGNLVYMLNLINPGTTYATSMFLDTLVTLATSGALSSAESKKLNWDSTTPIIKIIQIHYNKAKAINLIDSIPGKTNYNSKKNIKFSQILSIEQTTLSRLENARRRFAGLTVPANDWTFAALHDTYKTTLNNIPEQSNTYSEWYEMCDCINQIINQAAL
ncbi:MAG: hypothetical protein LBB39_02015 [Mycoplasmataceae bacterium]|nr:hypothetical protein [Mycoplasmataceae bacterium]